jgi:hypothetical protein
MGGATYYWRVHTAATAAIGATSATASFRIGPAIASGPYRLTITGPPYGNRTDLPNLRIFLDGDLTRRDGTLTFTMMSKTLSFCGPTGGDLILRVPAQTGRVSGTLVSNHSIDTTEPCVDCSDVAISATNPQLSHPSTHVALLALT